MRNSTVRRTREGYDDGRTLAVTADAVLTVDGGTSASTGQAHVD